jgi:hypothetical protein
MKRKVITFVLCGLLLFVGGCSKLSKENYDKLKIGMSYNEVVAIMGNADTCDAAMGAKNCIWGTSTKNITVKFMADNVVFFDCKGL